MKFGIPELILEQQSSVERIIEGVREMRQEKIQKQKEELGDQDDNHTGPFARYMANKLESIEQAEAISVDEFMEVTGFVIGATFNEKIDLFFKMIDTDGNGMLSWDEIYEICQDSLEMFCMEEDDKFINKLCKFFADYIFDKCGYDVSIFKDKGPRDSDKESSEGESGEENNTLGQELQEEIGEHMGNPRRAEKIRAMMEKI